VKNGNRDLPANGSHINQWIPYYNLTICKQHHWWMKLIAFGLFLFFFFFFAKKTPKNPFKLIWAIANSCSFTLTSHFSVIVDTEYNKFLKYHVDNFYLHERKIRKICENFIGYTTCQLQLRYSRQPFTTRCVMKHKCPPTRQIPEVAIIVKTQCQD
jgi:hypothetical protein